jgi:hypothetical protein
VRCREQVGGLGEWRVQIQEIERMRRFITEEEIMAKQTPAGGWTKKQLSLWRVPWPPPKNWKKRLLKEGIEDLHEELDKECDNARDRDQTGDKTWRTKK